MNNTTTIISPRRLGVAFGATGVVFYLGCIITMSTVSRATSIVFFNGLLHGLDGARILREHVPLVEVLLGIVSTFALGWFAGAMIAGFYDWGARRSRE
ncbi:MAG: DUF5676 family membrane protein [Spartobacteria bacterium]